MPEYASLAEGSSLPPRAIAPIQQIDVVRYAGASGDFNPIHTVPELALKAGLPGTIAHGMMSMGLLGTYLTDWMGDGARLVKFGSRFAAMTFPGDSLTLTAKISRKYSGNGEPRADLDLAVEKQGGVVTVKGWATVAWVKP